MKIGFIPLLNLLCGIILLSTSLFVLDNKMGIIGLFMSGLCIGYFIRALDEYLNWRFANPDKDGGKD